MKINLPYNIKKVDKIENNTINFSVVIISKNDSNYLQELLNGLNTFKEKGGEVLLLDLKSNDNTKEIANKWGCKVEDGESFFRMIDEDMSNVINEKFKRDENNIVNEGDIYIDYSGARDYSTSLVNNDMVLMIDPKSIIINFNIEEIVKFINNGFNYIDFTVHNKNENIYDFYNKRKYKWDNLIYEKLIPYNNDSIQTGRLPDDILSIESMGERFENKDNNIIPLSIDCFLGYNIDLLEKFAKELMDNKYYNSSIDLYNMFLSESEISNPMKSKIYVKIGDILMKSNREDESIDYYNKAYKIYSKWRTPLYKLAEYYFIKSEWDKSIFYAEGCLNIKRPEINLEEEEFYYQDGPYSILYVSYWWVGNPKMGKLYFDKALKINPRNKIYLSESPYHYKYNGNIIDGNLSFQEIQYLYNISKKYKSILEIGPERGRSTHAFVSSNDNLITVLNKNINTEDILNNLNYPGNIRFISEDDIENEKFELIAINCANLSHCDLRDLLLKYQFKSTKMIIGYNYDSNKTAVDETLEIDGKFENIWYKNISKFEKKIIYTKKEL